ncbi:hypothetical protein [Domibacillus epiphyticus]|uniref:Uncharacterized protein n=1 Tax=Domibacillus epiphyticus TaxID=1714355 RepID=A0A1V2ACS9_9BACI|nr:hypothetical protein [Domibacillus epiphyticus]OMP68767.1 hypothetical protein BTO28_01600 [Domibacillus epiphyticus]
MMDEILRIAEYCEKELALNGAKLPDEYYYTSVPHCVIDSVFSIGVRYESVKNTVMKFSDYFNLKKLRSGAEFPSMTDQLSVDRFLSSFEELGIDHYIHYVFKNKQRTSPKNGILKGKAVYRFCKVLQKYEVNFLQDVKNLYGNAEFEKEIKAIPGQKSGISLVYFYMLAGDDKRVKPDRMIVRFLEKVLQRKVKLDEAQNLLEISAKSLKSKYPNMNPRLLDYQIWNYARNKDAFK